MLTTDIKSVIIVVASNWKTDSQIWQGGIIMSDHKYEQTSDRSTSNGTRIDNGSSVSWKNYTGTKDRHDTQVDQYNIKDREGNHTFYSPKSGRMGEAGGNRDKNK